ncbi:MAG: hypothetical protein MRERV_40c015 [Mycoplasmataceae bacterium RV_VA103A]|nr:MAG: hypothetical protein MRERV_40c015 [Mycoplasmataceae bacterium RV_VA103A]
MLKDTRTSSIDLVVSNNNLLLKINCHNCQKPFTKKDIQENNYRFIVNYSNETCFGATEEYNKLEKEGEEYFLSLKVCRVEHKRHF